MSCVKKYFHRAKFLSNRVSYRSEFKRKEYVVTIWGRTVLYKGTSTLIRLALLYLDQSAVISAYMKMLEKMF